MKHCSNTTCTKANPQPLSQFYNDKSNKTDGKHPKCKTCKNATTMAWRASNREKYNASMRSYNQDNYGRLRLCRYKLSPEAYSNMLSEQKGLCAICHKLPNGKRPLAIDHNHLTGAVRGLLCYGCNRAIAILDKQDLLDKATAYLKKAA